GEPGGQSTGVVCHSEDLSSGPSDNSSNCLIARRMFPRESFRFDPSAMIANFLTSHFAIRISPQPQHVLHVVESGFLLHYPLRGPQSAIGEGLAGRSLVRQ